MARSLSSNRWQRRQAKDHYVQAAKKEGYRSRASFKLLEINKRHKLFKPGMRILELGAAPGGWTQVILKLIGGTGKLWALDILPMSSIPGVNIIQGDFNDNELLDSLQDDIGEFSLDWVISDMAPNLSGIKVVDQSKSMLLVEETLAYALHLLKPGGGLLVKVFQGAGIEQFVQDVKLHFAKVKFIKPMASRKESREVYLLAHEFRGNLG